jgi:hypothetical protein
MVAWPVSNDLERSERGLICLEGLGINMKPLSHVSPSPAEVRPCESSDQQQTDHHSGQTVRCNKLH